jgi:protein arginine N-methyltransferase 1
MYSIHGYGVMVADRRSDLYAEALRRTVRPGSVVVDLGAGPGIWAIYACALGARRVFAIEPDDVIGLAIDAARANGFADRITFIQRESTGVSLEEPADIVVADIRGVLPMVGGGLTGMIDARRFLSPTGVLIPLRDTIWVAVVQAPRQHQDRVQPWDERCFGLDFSAVRRAAVSQWLKERFAPDDLVTPSAAWAEIDYRMATNPSVSGNARLIADRSAVAHGLAVWFESDLTDDIRMSNRPGDPPVLYGQAFFPWPSAVNLDAGDVIDVRLRAAFNGSDYIMTWDTVVTGAGSRLERARFAQSTFDGLPLSLATLQRHAADAVVAPGPEREIERFVLDAFDGVRTQGAIAAALLERFPEQFSQRTEALARVAAIGLRVSARDDERGSGG